MYQRQLTVTVDVYVYCFYTNTDRSVADNSSVMRCFIRILVPHCSGFYEFSYQPAVLGGKESTGHALGKGVHWSL